jgi:uncharacterized membrane protein YoaK (UPF0700 family)
MDRERLKVSFALALAGCAGGVDAIGALLLLGVFPAHMTGNSVSAAIGLGHTNWADISRHAIPIPLFLLGIALGGILTELGVRRGSRAFFSCALGLEALLLLLWIVLQSVFSNDDALRAAPAWQFALLVGMPALAMGMQNMLLRRADGRNIPTTYVTGALVTAGEEGVTFLFWLLDNMRGRARTRRRRVLRIAHRQPSLGRFALFAGMVVLYILGAAFCVLLEQRWQAKALFLPLAGIAAAAIWNLARPIYRTPS